MADTMSELKKAMIDALYDFLNDGLEDGDTFSKEEFSIEYEKWGQAVAIFNMGYMAGRNAA